MKRIVTLLLLIPLFASAQDTCQLKKETDQYSHQTRISTGFVPFDGNGNRISISIDATSTEIDFFIWISGDAKCFDDASTMQVNYEGERLKANFKNTGSMNCEGAFHFTFRNTPGTPANLLRLTDRKISSLRILGPNKTTTDIVFTPVQKQQLMRMASCVVRDSKTLLKK